MGYDTEMLDEPAPVLELLKRDYTCVICQLILEDPVQVPKCGHTFCRACIRRWLSTNPTCPVDREEIKKKTKLTAPSRIITSMINNLKIHCRFKKDGCPEIRKVENMEAHESACGFEMISCELRCGTTFRRANQLGHHCVKSIVGRLKKDLDGELASFVCFAGRSLPGKVASARQLMKRIQKKVRVNLSSLKKVEATLKKRGSPGGDADTTSEDEDWDEDE